MLGVEVQSGEKALISLEPTWSPLASGSPFRSWDWAYHWWKTFLRADGARLRLVVLRDRETQEIRGIAPFYTEAHSHLLTQRTWRLLGDAGQSGQGMTEEPALLVRPGYEEAVLTTLECYFQTHAPSFDHAKLSLQVPLEQPLCLPPRVARGFMLREVKTKAGSSQVTLPDTWTAYRKSLSRSMRDNLAYYPRLLEREGHRHHVTFVETAVGLESALTDLVRLHRHRAACDEGIVHVNHMPTATHEAFLQAVFPVLVAQQRAFLALLSVEDNVIAAQAFFQDPEQLQFYYSGFDTAWKRYSPLLVLARAVLERALSQGVPRADFLPGHAPWQERWGAIPQKHLYEIRYTRTTPLSALRSLKYLIKKHRGSA